MEACKIFNHQIYKNIFTILLYQLSNSGYYDNLLDVLFLLAIACSIYVLINKNPIVSVLFLIGLFFSVACYLISIGLEFIGLSYLLVYVGAVSILFLFILMLINIRISELLSDTNKTIPLAILLGISFTYIGESLLPFSMSNSNIEKASIFKRVIGFDFSHFVTSLSWDTNLIWNSHISTIGNIMYTNYSIWLIIVSIILLLAMVGSIIITIK